MLFSWYLPKIMDDVVHQWIENAMNSPQIVKLNTSFDTVRLQQDLDIAVKNFQTAPQIGSYHDGSWKGIALRSIDGDFRNTVAHSLGTCKDTEVLDQCTYFREILHSFQFPVGVARLLFLPPGKKIGEHTDNGHGWHLGLVRLHIPIVTHPDVIMMVGGERCQWKPGEFWFGDFRLPHWLHNQSDITRVHLVIDCFVDDELLKLFPPAAVEAINASNHVYINNAAKVAEEAVNSYQGYFKLAKGFLPLFGTFSGKNDRLQLSVIGIPLPYAFSPINEHTFRLQDKTLCFEHSQQEQTIRVTGDAGKLDVQLQVLNQLSPLQKLYANFQYGVLRSGLGMALTALRGLRFWKRVTNSV